MFNRDAYSHPTPNVKYIKESVLGPGGDCDAFYSWFETTCCCLDSPCLENCICTKRYGINYIDGALTTDRLNKEPSIYECSAFCSCGNVCPNKLVQRGPNPYLEIKDAGNKGLGVFPSRHLKAGTFIAEYAGEIISENIAEVRYRADRNNKYILVMREHYNGNIVETCYDAYRFGNIARYINHSCSPNCTIIPVRTGCLMPKAAIFSTCEIAENEEITYSYSQGSTSLSETICHCKSTTCKGFLPSCVKLI